MEIITDNKIFWIEELFHSYLSLKKILFPRIVHFGLSIIGEMSFRDLRSKLQTRHSRKNICCKLIYQIGTYHNFTSISQLFPTWNATLVP